MADQQPATKEDLSELNVAFTATLPDLTAAVNRIQPNIVNDNHRRRDRFEEPIMASCNGNLTRSISRVPNPKRRRKKTINKRSMSYSNEYSFRQRKKANKKIFFGRIVRCKKEVLCDVLDMDVCHILLGQTWQIDNIFTYKRRDNLVLFHWGDRKNVMTPVNSSDESIDKKSNNNNRIMGSVSSLVKQPPIPEKTSEKEEVLPDNVQDEVVTVEIES
ncbi:hypothetical protein L6452_32150 [Arctium lappa]|uniref:Uncharacterized protein n=1 Tax=Arctium lappa TaxID=4217 RepID=A0ACB8Z4N4_ARCLA|nr:hypothetical protein L6452_32150 [Arctium lappa]